MAPSIGSRKPGSRLLASKGAGSFPSADLPRPGKSARSARSGVGGRCRRSARAGGRLWRGDHALELRLKRKGCQRRLCDRRGGGDANHRPGHQRPARRLHERWLSRLTGVMPARMARMRAGKSSRSRRCLRCIGRMQYGHRSMPSSRFAKAVRRACWWVAPSPTGGVRRVAVMVSLSRWEPPPRLAENRSRAREKAP